MVMPVPDKIGRRAARGQKRRMRSEKQMLTPGDVARMLDVDDQTVRNWVDAGELPGVRLGGKILIARAVVEAIIAAAGGRSDAELAQRFAHTAVGTRTRR
jgi:excisionase family DNA binding protein